MKNFLRLLFLATAFFQISCATAQQWYSSGVPYHRHVNSVKIVKPDMLILGGGNAYNDSLQTIYRSSDLGLSWNFEDHISSWIRSVDFADSLHGFAVGYNGKMVSTNDGAVTWNTRSSPVARHFFNVFYNSPQILFVAGGSYNEDTSTILKSTDGGNTWNVVYNAAGAWLRSVYFQDALNGFAVGDSGTILTTTNGGANWNITASPVHRDFYGIAFANSTGGFIVGGASSVDSSERTILHTTNGGLSWSVLKNERGGILTAIDFNSATNGHIVGDSATLMTTVNAGASWTPETVSGAIINTYFTSVDFYNDSLGVIGAKGGTNYVYTSAIVPQVITGEALVPDSVSALLQGQVNTHSHVAVYSFLYSTDSLFNSYYQSADQTILSDSLSFISTSIIGLTPDTVYYYYLSARTLSGEVHGAVHHFRTSGPFLNMSTQATVYVNVDSMVFKGTVSGFQTPVSLFFEYGTTPQLGNQITATPAVVSDPGSHLLSATIYSLTNGATYYYRLKGVTANGVYYGNTLSYLIGVPFQTLRTMPPVNLTDTSADLSGEVDGFTLSANLNFEFGTSPSFGTTLPVVPAVVTDTSYHALLYHLAGLLPLQNYYYRLRAITSSGVYYSDTTLFTLGHSIFTVKSLPATEITPGSARLNALIKLDTTVAYVTMGFEYGADSSLGSIAPISPDTIHDLLLHTVSAPITGLASNKNYYFRLNGVTPTGIPFHSDIRQLFTGVNPIPNHDLENWTHLDQPLLSQWINYGNATSTASYHAGKAAYLSGTPDLPGGMVALGLIIPGQPSFGGAPFNARPDSVIFFANYNIAIGDTGSAIVIFKRNGINIGRTTVPITGNSGGVFKRISYPLTYTAAGNPDTIMTGFISTNLFGGLTNGASWVKVDDLSFSGTGLTVPNADFETWDTLHYDLPDEWYTKLRELPINLFPSLPIAKTSDAYSGNSAARIRNVMYGDYGLAGLLTTDHSSNGRSYFAVNNRYQSFNGYFKFLQDGTDTLSMIVEFHKNGTPIGTAYMELASSVSQYTLFDIPIHYNQEGLIPDSAYITFNACNGDPHGNSVVYLDDLNFDGFHIDSAFPSDILESRPEQMVPALNLYPNPTGTVLNVEFDGAAPGEITYRIYNLNGQVVKMQTGKFTGPYRSSATFDVSDLEPDIYILQLTDARTTTAGRFVIMR